MKILVIKFCKEVFINVLINEFKFFIVMLGRVYYIIYIILFFYISSKFNVYVEMEWVNGKKEMFFKSSISNFFIKIWFEFF